MAGEDLAGDHLSGEDGSVLPALAVLILGGLIALGLAFDVGRWASTWREAAFAADAGAQAGASMLDEQAAYDGRVQLDLPPAEVVATEAALAARPRPGRRVLAEVRLTRLCVTVEQLFRPTLLRSVGIGETAVRASACAAPWRG